MEINITKIRIVKNDLDLDEVFLHTTLPSTMPNITKQNVVFQLKVASNMGKDYCELNFPNVPIEVEISLELCSS